MKLLDQGEPQSARARLLNIEGRENAPQGVTIASEFSGQSEDAHCNTLTKHRNSEHGAETARSLPFFPCEIGIGQNVGNVDHLPSSRARPVPVSRPGSTGISLT